MGEISSELKSFKSSVESSIGSMNSSCTTILDKIQEMTSIAQTTKSGIDTYYASSNTAALTRRFERVNDYCMKNNIKYYDTYENRKEIFEDIINNIDRY